MGLEKRGKRLHVPAITLNPLSAPDSPASWPEGEMPPKAFEVAQWHGSVLGAEFDHSPMAAWWVFSGSRWVRPKQAGVGI